MENYQKQMNYISIKELQFSYVLEELKFEICFRFIIGKRTCTVNGYNIKLLDFKLIKGNYEQNTKLKHIDPFSKRLI